MPADFNEPGLTSAYTDVLSVLKERDVDALTLCVNDPSNIPTGAMKWLRASSKFQERVAGVWEDKVLSIAGGGTGGATASAARTALGLGTIATQDGNNVNITGGTIGTLVDINGSRITSGTVPSARLGSGGAGAGAKVLADNQTFIDIPGAPAGSGMLWFTNSAPTGYLLCDGSAVSRTTYSALFGVIGTTYGVGDGSTTFNLPDLRQRIPIGRAASGTGSTLAGTFGAIDHTHTGPSHTHTYTDVINHTHTITITDPGHTHSAHGHTVSSDAQVGIHFATWNLVGGNTGSATTGITASSANPAGGTATGTTAAGGTGATGSSNPPCLVINYIIKT